MKEMKDVNKGAGVQLQTAAVPLFSDNVFITVNFKESKTKKRTATVKLSFADMATKRIISEIVVDSVTAEGLQDVLKNKLDEVNNVLKSKNFEKEIKKFAAPAKATEQEEPVYTG